MRPQTFHDDLYDVSFRVYVGAIPEAIEASRLEVEPDSDMTVTEGLAGVVDGVVVICLQPGVGPSVVAHEITHAKNMVFEMRGIGLDTSNDEPEAYYMGWLAKRVADAVGRAMLKRKP